MKRQNAQDPRERYDCKYCKYRLACWFAQNGSFCNEFVDERAKERSAPEEDVAWGGGEAW